MTATITTVGSQRWSNPNPPVSDAIAVTSVPVSASLSHTILVSGTYQGHTPTGITATWTGAINATPSGFSASGGSWSASVVTPSGAASYALTVTGTGPNTSTSAPSSSVVVAAETFVVTSVPGTALISTAVSVSGTYTGGIPSNMTAVWNSGSIAGTVSAFAASGGTWHAQVVTPSSAATYTLTATAQGGNTTTSAPAGSCVVSAGSTIASVAHTKIPGNQNGGTSPGINTTGANFIAVTIIGFQPTFGGSFPPVVTDIFGNTYLGLTGQTETSGSWTQLFYCANPIVGSGHTFSQSRANSYSIGFVEAFSGVAGVGSLSSQNGNALTGTPTTIQPGSVTPPTNGCLVISAVGVDAQGTTLTVNDSLTITDQDPGQNATWYGGAMGYLIQGSAGALNPTWTLSLAAVSSLTSVIAVFLPQGANSLSITSIPGTGTVNGGIAVSGGYSGAAPTGLTAAWSGGGGSGTVSGFAASGGTWSATIAAPASAATYTLVVTGTGPNTSVSAPSGNIVISAVSNTITITSLPATAPLSTGVQVNGTYTGAPPAGLTAAWSGSGGSGAVSNFAAGGGTWLATIVTPASGGNYTLQVTGTSGNTATSPPSTTEVVTGSNTITITAIAATANVNTNVPVSGTYTGLAPTGATASWTGPIAGTVTAFAAAAGVWSCSVMCPASNGTYAATVTGTGPNTSVSSASGNVTVSTATGPATIRIAVGATNYDLDLGTKISEQSYVRGAPYNINQLCYLMPPSAPLSAALPGIVVRYRPDSNGARQEVIAEMSQAIGPNRNALAIFSMSLLNGDGSAVQMTTGSGDGTLASSLTASTQQVMYQSWRMVTAVRPAVVTPAQLAASGATATYNAGGPTPNEFLVTPYAPLGSCGVVYNQNPGGRPEIGLFPEYDSQWLALQDSTSYTAMIRAAEAYSSLAILARDSNGQLFSMDNFPGWGPNGSGASNTWAFDLSGNPNFPPNWDVPHIGQFSFIPAMVTGDLFYLERLQAGINTTMCALTGGNGMGLVTGTQLRGMAWSLRDLCCAILATPTSGLPSTMLTQTYLLKKLENNVTFISTSYISGLFPEANTFHLLYAGNYFADNSGFMNWYLAQVLGWAVWAGFTNIQPLVDWHAVFALNVGNGTSGWGHTQPAIGPYTAGSFSTYYHGDFAHGDGTPCTSWTDAWDTNMLCPTATFTGTITGGTTLSLSGVTGSIGVCIDAPPGNPSNMTIYGNGIANSGQSPLILSGGGSSFTLASAVSNVGPETMVAQYNPGPSGPFTADGTNLHYEWGTPDPITVGGWNTSIGSAPFSVLIIDGTYTPLYAAGLRGYIAAGHSELVSVLAGWPPGSDLQFMWNYVFNSRTPPTVPAVTVDTVYISPFLNIGSGSFAAFNFQISQFLLGSGGLLQMAFVNSSQLFINCGNNTMKAASGNGLYIIKGTGGTVQTSDGHNFNMATLSGLPLGPFTF